MPGERLSFRNALLFGLATFVPGVITGWLAGPSLAATYRSEPQTGSETEIPTAHLAGNALSSTSESEFMARLHDALSISHRAQCDRAIAALADGLNVPEIRDALERLDKIHLRERGRIRKALLARWGELDPEGAIAFAMTVSNASDRAEAVSAVLGGWIEKDAQAAETWVAALQPGALKTSALRTLVRGIAISNPRHALELAQDIPSESFFGVSSDGVSDLVHTIFDKWIDDDPMAAAAAASKLPAKLQIRDMAMHLIGKRWAERDLDRALAWVESLQFNMSSTAGHQVNALTGVLETWLTKNPNAAIDWMNNFPDDSAKVGLLQTMAFNLAARNPADAVALAMAIPPGSARDQALSYPIYSWIRNEPNAAADWALHHDDENARRVALQNVASDWIRDDPATARAWIHSLPGGATKDTMLLDAATVIANGISYGDRYDGPLIGSMSSKAIQTAAEALMEIGDATQRTTACLTLAGKWLSIDPEAARTWISSLPVTPQEKEELLKAKANQWPPR
jgi:uncharacterized membrane protein